MEELLKNLRKAVDRALDAHAPSTEISIEEFPGYVIKSLEAVLTDTNSERATSRLTALKAKVDEAVGITKETVGAAEDLDSQKITVTVFEESGLTAKPGGTDGSTPSSSSGDGAASAAPDDALGKALELLREEVAELKRSFGGKDDEDDKKKAKAKDDEEDDKKKAKGKDDEEDDKKKAKGQDDEEDDKKKAKGQDDEEDDKKKAKGKDDEEDDKKKAKGQDNEEDDKKKAKGNGDDDRDDDVNKSVGWPTDMNETMPGVEPIEKRSPELAWGSDPKPQTEAR